MTVCAGKNGSCSIHARFSVLKTQYCGHHARQAVQHAIGAIVRGVNDNPDRLDYALGINMTQLFGKPKHASGEYTLGLLGEWWESLDDGNHDLTTMACIVGNQIRHRRENQKATGLAA